MRISPRILFSAALAALLLAAEPLSAAEPQFDGRVSGIELLPQSSFSGAVFLFEFRGSFATSLLAVTAYGSVLVAGQQGWIASVAIGPPEPTAVLLTKWVVTSSAVEGSSAIKMRGLQQRAMAIMAR